MVVDREKADQEKAGKGEAPSVAPTKAGQAGKETVMGHLEDVAAMEATVESRLVLSEADRATLKFKAGRGLIRVVVAQAVMGLAAALISWLIAGAGAGASALIGAGAYFVPNALFAMRLLLGLLASKPASPVAFFMGEIIKLGSAVVLLALAVHLWQSWLVWPALLFGLVCVLKGYVLLMLFHKLP